MIDLIYVKDTQYPKMMILRERAKKLLLVLLGKRISSTEPVTPVTVTTEIATPTSKHVLSEGSSSSFYTEHIDHDEWSCSTLNDEELEEYLNNYNNQYLRERD